MTRRVVLLLASTFFATSAALAGVTALHPVLLGAISLDLFAVLFGGAVALLPAIAEDRLGVGAIGLGWLRAAGGIGAAIVAITLAARPVPRHVGLVLLIAVTLSAEGEAAPPSAFPSWRYRIGPDCQRWMSSPVTRAARVPLGTIGGGGRTFLLRS